jgi:polyisoprenoid-binding protein YceI
MERNRVSPIQAIVAIFVVLLIGFIFLLPLLRSATTATDTPQVVAQVATATPLLLAATQPPPTATPLRPTAVPSPTLSPTPIPQLAALPTPTLAVATVAITQAVTQTNTSLPLPTATPDIERVIPLTVTEPLTITEPLTVAEGLTAATLENSLPTNTPTQRAVAATPTPTYTPVAEPTVAITDTPTPTPTPEPAADLTFGYLLNQPACQMVTDIVTQLITENYQLRIRKLAFASEAELFTSLAQQEKTLTPIDITFCYRFPNDGKYLKQHGSLIQIVGNDYAQEDKIRWYVMVHSALSIPLREEQPCVYELIQLLNFETMQFSEQDADSWIRNHPDVKAELVNCKQEKKNTGDNKPTAWQIDFSHSRIQFSARHLMLSNVIGEFQTFTGTVNLDANNPANTVVDITIDAASLETRDEQRNQDLRSANFLDVALYPSLHFKSTAVTLTSSNTAQLLGDLTMRDVTRPVILDVNFLGQAISPRGAVTYGFEAYTQINREDWGLTWNVVLETGGVLVGKEIDIDIALELVNQ